MNQRVPFAVVAAILAGTGAAAQTTALPDTMQTGQTPVPSGVAVPPAPPAAYLLPLPPRDDRPARQRCEEGELARLGTSPTALDRTTIALRCSQR